MFRGCICSPLFNVAIGFMRGAEVYKLSDILSRAELLSKHFCSSGVSRFSSASLRRRDRNTGASLLYLSDLMLFSESRKEVLVCSQAIHLLWTTVRLWQIYSWLKLILRWSFFQRCLIRVCPLQLGGHQCTLNIQRCFSIGFQSIVLIRILRKFVQLGDLDTQCHIRGGSQQNNIVVLKGGAIQVCICQLWSGTICFRE